jgi:D-proline reductase (dithiol) PrdB
MARLEDIPEPTRSAVSSLPCPSFDSRPFVAGPPLAQRRVAIISSAALIRRGDKPFPVGSAEFRSLPSGQDGAEILISHVSINFDRAGFQRDLNTVYPIDRLRELASEGLIGSVASQHFTMMGSTDPTTMIGAADQIAAALHADKVNAVVLTPV